MNNPFSVWRELRKIYLKYIDTGLPIKYKQLEDERRSLLEEQDALCKHPIIELVPRYEEYCTMNDACQQLNLLQSFASFAKKGLFPDRGGVESKLYEHQFNALKAAVVDRKNIIATTGTGSGKTECFLLPLLYDIFKEKANLKEKAMPAVRGLILYPLNALAEDQMRRLRRSLSSGQTIEYLNQHLNGHRISFGRYTGITPVSGRPTDSRRAALRQDRQGLIRDWEAAKSQAARTGNDEYLYDIPNMDVGNEAELWDRWSMQQTPPDILITNYSMLNIMLMRAYEDPIFAQTRNWLDADTSNKFHLVVDELHSYRGTSGTEVAYLIRLLLMRLGRTVDSSQIQFLCSSASMEESLRTKKFITGFFGFEFNQYDDRFVIIKDERKPPQTQDGYLDPEPYLKIIEASNTEAIKQLFVADDVIDRLRQAIPKAEECTAIAQSLFATNTPKTMEALEGLLVGLSKIKNEKGDTLQPQRAHYFFRNNEGLWACTNPECSEVENRFRFPNRTIGKLYRRPQTACKCGCIVLELLLCRQCGEHYVAGWEKQEDGRRFLSAEKEAFDTTSRYYTIFTGFGEEDDRWKKCNLSLRDGAITFTRLGTLLVFVPEADYPALYPNHCYSCDFKVRVLNSRTLTPVFKHYTGVQKINQLMADSLMLSLEKHLPAREKPKLVLFSDSRQAAAKLAAGIELDHYRDSVRAIMLTNLDAKSEDKNLLQKYWLHRSEMTTTDFEKLRELAMGNEYQVILNEINYSNDTNNAKLAYFFNSRNAVRIDRIETSVMNNLFSVGINPGGSAPSINDGWEHNYDFDSGKFIPTNSAAGTEFLHMKIQRYCKKEILLTLFAHNKRSFESLLCRIRIMLTHHSVLC